MGDARRVADVDATRAAAYNAPMHASDLDPDAIGVLRALSAADVQFVLLEDEDHAAMTLVAGPAGRNLDRLARVLKRLAATVDGTGRRPDLDELVRSAPSRWPLRIAGTTVDLVRVGVDDGRWSSYFDQARATEVGDGLRVDVVPDVPLVSIIRGDAFAAMPELALTRRERERVRRRRREELSRAERRGARRARLAWRS